MKGFPILLPEAKPAGQQVLNFFIFLINQHLQTPNRPSHLKCSRIWPSHILTGRQTRRRRSAQGRRWRNNSSFWACLIHSLLRGKESCCGWKRSISIHPQSAHIILPSFLPSCPPSTNNMNPNLAARRDPIGDRAQKIATFLSSNFGHCSIALADGVNFDYILVVQFFHYTPQRAHKFRLLCFRAIPIRPSRPPAPASLSQSEIKSETRFSSSRCHVGDVGHAMGGASD